MIAASAIALPALTRRFAMVRQRRKVSGPQALGQGEATVYAGTQACLPCTVGHYCVGGYAPPAACPAGTFLNGTAASTLGQCRQCANGTYAAVAGAASCTACMARRGR